ncbi:ferrous iron transport protein B [Marinomonas rhizomae]|uniref:Ferrous iron transport protein B n=1 Tax=Marinomonas rhizomae TaxID=491948 RepID=A0A366J454_9GAMM|nr:ferrous iron transport protein B [Marinomonas rhizomae]RBP81129.1 ferrous iron transport protein B [Marinomonas rhizomae]RNF72287.1 ferrous iron transport protein B [Marinomonas rhizomae]
MNHHITLVGNPNTGKTTLFNKLAGTRQKVGNWAGVTVDCKTGFFSVNEQRVDMTDLPGIYSFATESGGIDEAVARRFLGQGEFDVIINVVDATNLKRNLKLTKELITLGRPMIVVMTMTDLARKMRIMPDLDALAANMGIATIDGYDLSVAELQNQVLALVEMGKDNFVVAEPKSIKQWLSGVMLQQARAQNSTELIDRVVLHPLLGIPIFLLSMYAMFALAIGLGTLFIDPIDSLTAYWFVAFPSHWMQLLGVPHWIIVVLADGLGGGAELVATFVPVIACLYLCLSFLEDSGYMARAAFIIDRVMLSIGLPGQAFIPLLLGFGCNVTSIMSTRSLSNPKQRMLTMAMAPFMSCSARLAVYVMFVSVFFRSHGGSLVFGLYLLGIVMAVGTAWIFRKQLFNDVHASSFIEMPHYHRPRWGNIALSSWHKVRGFVIRAGKTIVVVSAILTILNSIPSWHSDADGGKPSALAEVGQVITPVFTPIGMGYNNWPAAVGVFTGVLAKEAVVGTMDALYSDVVGSETDSVYEPPINNLQTSGAILWGNLTGAVSTLVDPLGLAAVSDAQHDATLSLGHQKMASLFEGWQGAFAYLVFVLLYTPCAAAIGALVKEGGMLWTGVVTGWSTSVAYVGAVCTFQVLTFAQHPFSSLMIMGIALVWIVFFVLGLKSWIKPKLGHNIIAVG